MDREKKSLIVSAAKLHSLGLHVEAARERLRLLVKRGIPYDSEEMKRAYQEFMELDRQWKELEQQHLALRDEALRK